MAKKEMIKSFVLRVDAETMEAIEKWAAEEFINLLKENAEAAGQK